MFNYFNVLGKLKLDIETTSNPFNFNLENLFKMGARENPKRKFLFVSTLLGKHLEVHPQIPKIAGHLLANSFLKECEGVYFSDVNKLSEAVKDYSKIAIAEMEINKTYDLKEKTLFIGFAETATGLGHSVSSAFNNAYFVHTTREELFDKQSVFDFKEEHSHAVDHLCYLQDISEIEKVSHIVLIDDEITTGKTCLNLIKSLNVNFPGKEYTILALLDWRTKEYEKMYEDFQLENNIKIRNVSLLRGDIAIHNNPTFENKEDCAVESEGKDIYRFIPSIGSEDRVICKNNQGESESYVLKTGRFGISSLGNSLLEEECSKIAEVIRPLRKGKKTLCVGSGEFIYIPSRIASYMGEGISFKSSTRSPIFVDADDNYPINDRIKFNITKDVVNYIYNLSNNNYDELIMFFEVAPSHEVMNDIFTKIRAKGIENISFIIV